MRKFIILVIFWLIVFKARSQSYLIHHRNGESLIIANLNIPGEYTSLATGVFGNFCGYELTGDSIICLFEIRGKVFTQKFLNPISSKLISYKTILNPPYESSRLKTYVYYFDDYELIIHNGNRLRLIKNSSVLWDNKSLTTEIVIDSSKSNYSAGYRHPQVSPSANSILLLSDRDALFNSWQKVIEIDLKTGEESIIGKGKDPSYSPDGSYILYKSNYNQVFLYDKINKKRIKYLDSQTTAFWLYKP